MLENSNNSSLNAGSSQGYAIWQSEWLEALWNQLTDGTYNGLGNVVVDGDVAQSEQRILSDLDAIDRMLLGEQGIQQSLSEVQDFAARSRDYLNSNTG